MRIVELLAALAGVVADLVELIAALLDRWLFLVLQLEVVADHAELIAPSRLGLRRLGFELAEAVRFLAGLIHSRRLDLRRIESICRISHADYFPDWSEWLIQQLRIDRIPKSNFHPRFGMHRWLEQVGYSKRQYLITITRYN